MPPSDLACPFHLGCGGNARSCPIVVIAHAELLAEVAQSLTETRWSEKARDGAYGSKRVDDSARPSRQRERQAEYTRRRLQRLRKKRLAQSTEAADAAE